jgi:hypothetical protein
MGQPEKIILEIRDDSGKWFPAFDQPRTVMESDLMRDQLMIQGFKVRVRLIWEGDDE